MATRWHIQGDYVLACNCDYGCPCNFNARPTMGFCQGVLGFRVADGAYGDVRLDGQKVFLALKWPGAIHEGNGVAAFYIDEGASPAQREALLKIVSGEAGGPPFAILATTYSHVLEPRFVKITLMVAGKDTEVAVDGRFRISFQPIRNPVTKAEAYPKVVLPQGFIFQEGEQYALKEFWVNDSPELSFAHPGKCAELAKVRWQGP
ncbi:MAG: DUF1326 domain-containing protein [bacterium]